MNGITTHVLDLAGGRPRAGLAVALARRDAEGWRQIAEAVTDQDGRVRDWPTEAAPTPGEYRLTFATGGFYPEVSVVFRIGAGEERTHIPLLLSPFGYSTYRGS